jgi:hypothetical protein
MHFMGTVTNWNVTSVLLEVSHCLQFVQEKKIIQKDEDLNEFRSITC